MRIFGFCTFCIKIKILTTFSVFLHKFSYFWQFFLILRRRGFLAPASTLGRIRIFWMGMAAAADRSKRELFGSPNCSNLRICQKMRPFLLQSFPREARIRILGIFNFSPSAIGAGIYFAQIHMLGLKTENSNFSVANVRFLCGFRFCTFCIKIKILTTFSLFLHIFSYFWFFFSHSPPARDPRPFLYFGKNSDFLDGHGSGGGSR